MGIKLKYEDFDESNKITSNQNLYKSGKLYSSWAHELIVALQCTKDESGNYVNSSDVLHFAKSVLLFEYFQNPKDLFYYFAFIYIERYFIIEDKRVVIHLLAVDKYNDDL